MTPFLPPKRRWRRCLGSRKSLGSVHIAQWASVGLLIGPHARPKHMAAGREQLSPATRHRSATGSRQLAGRGIVRLRRRLPYWSLQINKRPSTAGGAPMCGSRWISRPSIVKKAGGRRGAYHRRAPALSWRRGAVAPVAWRPSGRSIVRLPQCRRRWCRRRVEELPAGRACHRSASACRHKGSHGTDAS